MPAYDRTDAKQLGPGLYLTPDETLHVDVPELLRDKGFANTPENREMIAQDMAAIVRTLSPVTEVRVK